ncbi:hypothetical protein BKA63DRAFT_28670 [Paraphoma chrysanthemicola]|nr:hypothetical protein BKA63DRAFT_28670 [Paraphoma chrysanthemicola]
MHFSSKVIVFVPLFTSVGAQIESLSSSVSSLAVFLTAPIPDSLLSSIVAGLPGASSIQQPQVSISSVASQTLSSLRPPPITSGVPPPSFITSASRRQTPSSTASMPGDSSPAATVDTTQPRGGLSAGAKTGIGVAIPSALFLLAGLCLLLWRRRRKAGSTIKTETPSAKADDLQTAHSGLMVAGYEDTHDPRKSELDSILAAFSSLLPMYTHPQPSSKHAPSIVSHELDAPASNIPLRDTPEQTSHELPSSTHVNAYQPPPPAATQTLQTHFPADVGLAIVIPAPYIDENAELERLKAQRAALARERERKEEIERMRREEERLDWAIRDLEVRRRGT